MGPLLFGSFGECSTNSCEGVRLDTIKGVPSTRTTVVNGVAKMETNPFLKKRGKDKKYTPSICICGIIKVSHTQQHLAYPSWLLVLVHVFKPADFAGEQGGRSDAKKFRCCSWHWHDHLVVYKRRSVFQTSNRRQLIVCGCGREGEG